MIDFRRLGMASMFLILLAAGPARAAPEVGWWWNPNESGRGFFVESQNGIMYLAGYFYEPDGRATWLVSGGPNADPYNYQGRLLSYSNGQTLFGDYKPPVAPLDAGPVAISFSDDTHGTIVWPGGTIPVVRQTFGAGRATFGAENGWWWNEAESGRGYSIEVQGDKIFVVSFMYDDAGRPVWYYSAGTMSSPTTYAGPWLQFAGGQTMLGPYQPPGTPTVVGQLSIQFAATDQATLTFADTLAATETPTAQSKRQKVVYATREFKTKFPLPERWNGGFTFYRTDVNERKASSSPGQTQIINWKWTATDVVLERDYDLADITPFPGSSATHANYYIKSGTLVAAITYFHVSSDNKELCESKPNQIFGANLASGEIKVVANENGDYKGAVDQKPGTVNLPLTCKQQTSSGERISDVSYPISINLGFSLGVGKVASGAISGKIPEQEVVLYDVGLASSKMTTSASWYFETPK